MCTMCLAKEENLSLFVSKSKTGTFTLSGKMDQSFDKFMSKY